MKRIILLLISILMTLSITCSSFAAYSPKLDGKPEGFKPGNSIGYFIWQDKGELHIRTTTSGDKHVFSGTIHTDGYFEDTFGIMESDDDYLHINEDRDKINFQFTDIGGTTGIDLCLKDGTYMTFNLSMDGNEIDYSKIFIGENGWHPGSNKFTLRHEYDMRRPEVFIEEDPWSWWHCGPRSGPAPGPDPWGRHW